MFRPLVPCRNLLRMRLGAPLMRFSSTIAPKPANTTLTWPEFFSLRQRQRRIDSFCSIGTTLAATAVAGAYFANIEFDVTQKIFEIEIVWFYGLAIFLCGFLGYCSGPTVGTAIFKTSLGKRMPAFIEKDAEFLRHIQANRPDATKQNYTNPLTDYYGEKITSLHAYRKWLRESRLFTRKSQKFL